jgi:hypothetical protein
LQVLDRGWGKPTQQVAANVSFFDQMSDEEQRIMLAALEALRDAYRAVVADPASSRPAITARRMRKVLRFFSTTISMILWPSFIAITTI